MAGASGRSVPAVAVSAGFPVARQAPARSRVPVAAYPAVDQSFGPPRRAGWSVGDVRVLTAEGPAWHRASCGTLQRRPLPNC
jgi:hypothetical protein